MDCLRWMMVWLVGCGPNIAGESESDSEADTGSEGGGPTSGEPDTSAGPTSTSSSSTADPTVMSTVTTVDPESSSGAPETDGATDCPGGGGSSTLGLPCVANSDCMSGVCRAFSDAPPDPDRHCAPAPADCSTAISGTVWRLPPGPAGLPDVPVRVVGALDAITDPFGATPLFTDTSDASGRTAGTTDGPATSSVAIVAVTGGDATWFPTAVGVANQLGDGTYEVGTNVHDLWAVQLSTLDAFNVALAADPSVPAELLPLGEAGGVIGIVRDSGGTPIEGAVVESTDGGSQAIVRYVTDQGGIDTTGTHGSGAFIVLGVVPTGEDFAATLEGVPLAAGRAASANGLVFALVMTAV
jgi:hypothetical protein